jgi:hypothetical protein
MRGPAGLRGNKSALNAGRSKATHSRREISGISIRFAVPGGRSCFSNSVCELRYRLAPRIGLICSLLPRLAPAANGGSSFRYPTVEYPDGDAVAAASQTSPRPFVTASRTWLIRHPPSAPQCCSLELMQSVLRGSRVRNATARESFGVACGLMSLQAHRSRKLKAPAGG